MAALSIIKGAVKYGPKAVKKIKEGLKRRKKKKEALKLKKERTPQERKLLKETMNEVLGGKSNKEIATSPKMRKLTEKAKEAKAKRAFEKKMDDKKLDSLLKRASDSYFRDVDKNLAKKMDSKYFKNLSDKVEKRLQAEKAKPKKKMMGGGKVMKYQKGGRVKMDGCATRGKTRGRMV